MSAALFAHRFEEVVGEARIATIDAAMTDEATILLAGDPATGKTSVALRLAEYLESTADGTGALVRRLAAKSGVSLADFNAQLESHPESDHALDAEAALAIARGDVVVFESRLAGHLGSWLRRRGRRNLVTVYLTCAPVQQARRLVAREGGDTLREVVDAALNKDASARSLEGCAAILRRLGIPEASTAADLLDAEGVRASADRERMRRRYGVSLGDPEVYDVVLDTTELTVDAVARRLLDHPPMR